MLVIKTPEQRHWSRSGVFIVNSEHILHLVLVFLFLTLNMWLLAGLEQKKLHLVCQLIQTVRYTCSLTGAIL